jgi:glycogen debranching enzyme
LSPSDEKYRARYGGNALERDGALHNGPAFPWLLGPYVQLLLRVSGANSASRAAAYSVIRANVDYAAGQGMGQIPELFDGESRHNPGGAIASGASVGEILRIYSESVLSISPTAEVPERVRPIARAHTAKESAQAAQSARDLPLRSAQD